MTDLILQGSNACTYHFAQVQRSWALVAVCCYLAHMKSAAGIVSAQSGKGDKPTTGPSSGSPTGGRDGSSIGDSGIEDGVASYTRYSSENQDCSSIEQQDSVIEAGALKRRHRVSPTLKFSDEAVSGTKLVREGLDRLMEAARSGQIKVLYLYSLSRLARESLISLGLLKELVEVLNIQVISVSEGIDTEQANWDLLATIFSYQHGQYIKTLRADVLRGQQFTIDNDYSVGDWCFGYGSEIIPGQENTARFKRGKPRKRVVIKADDAAIVCQVFHWYVHERRSINWIARELTRRGVQKLHGGRGTKWYHDTISHMLENRKYIGDWQWGAEKTKRIPMTGKIFKAPRTPEELAPLRKDRPHLRIVDDALFYAAQERLEQSKRKYNTERLKDGRFRGTTNDHSQPRHLLQGLLQCGQCGATFNTSGGASRRMQCPNYKRGTCTAVTTLLRDDVAKELLDVIRHRIVTNPDWIDIIRRDLKQANAAYRANLGRTAELERQLNDVRRKIAKLVDCLEEDHPDPTIMERLKERRDQQNRWERELLLAQAKHSELPDNPPDEWIFEKLNVLSTVLAAEPTRAGVVLQQLLGKVVVRQVKVPGHKPLKHEVDITIDSTRIMKTAFGYDVESSCKQPEMVTLPLSPPPPWAAKADDIMVLFNEGKAAYAISEKLKCHYSWVAKGVAWWHAQRGLPSPTYQDKRSKLDKLSRAEELADTVKRMIDDNIPLKDIAKALGCHKDTVTAAKKSWYERNGLPVPDGRLLRRLRNPNSRRRAS